MGVAEMVKRFTSTEMGMALTGYSFLLPVVS